MSTRPPAHEEDSWDPDDEWGAPPATPTRGRRWLYWVGFGCLGLVGFSLIALVVAGVLMQAHYLPPEDLVRGDQLGSRIRGVLEEEVLMEDEEVRWFYSAAFFDPRVDGNVLTDQRVISYWLDDREDELVLDWTWLADVTAVRVDFSGASAEDTSVHVWERPWRDDEGDGEWYGGIAEPPLLLYLSAGGDLDHQFVADLVEAARGAGATIAALEFMGDYTPAELARIEPATAYHGEFDTPPPAIEPFEAHRGR